MKNTTLCYIEQGSRCLMLHRTKKANDENEGKWICLLYTSDAADE